MNKPQLKKVFPMLEIMSNLSDEEVQIMIPFLNHDVCLGILECIDHGICNTTIPEDVKNALKEKLIKHKKKLRYLINKDEFRTKDPLRRTQILEKKKRILLRLGGNCVSDVLGLAIPALGDYIRRKSKAKKE
jgi:hypothetical protein